MFSTSATNSAATTSESRRARSPRAGVLSAFPLTGETPWTPTMRFVLAAILTAVLALVIASIAGGWAG